MNDERDHFVRWIQGISAIPIFLVGVTCLYFLFTGGIFGIMFFFKGGFGSGAFYLAYRCLFCAFTGRRNINRDDF